MHNEGIEDLVQRIADAEADLEKFIHSHFDAVVDPVSAAPILLLETRVALQESETRFRTLAESTSAIILILQQDQIRYANPAAETFTGYPFEDLLQKSLWELLKPELQDELRLFWGENEQLLPKGTELRFVSREGEERVLEISAGQMSYEGQPAWIVTGFDVTGRVKAEESLQIANQELRIAEQDLLHASELLEKVFASIDIMIALLDRDFNFLRVNRAYAEAVNQEPEYFPGKNHFELYPNAENQAIFTRVVETGQPFYVYEKAFEYKDAPERGITYWDWSLQPVTDTHSEVQGVVLSLIDVTDRKRAEDQVRLSAQRSETLARISRLLVEAGPDERAVVESVVRSIANALAGACILSLVSADGDWLVPAGFHHHDAQIDAALGENLKERCSSSTKEGIVGRVYQTGEAVLISSVGSQNHNQLDLPELFPSTGTLGWTSLLVVPLRLPGRNIGTLVVMGGPDEEVLTCEDQSLLQSVADQASLAVVNARLYQDLGKALQEEKAIHSQLVQAEKHTALSRMVASVAHELNNPVQTIQNCLYLTQQDISIDSPIQEYLEMALSETQRVARLVAQLRAIYRPNRPEAMEPLDLVQMLTDCLALLDAHLQHERVTLHFECPSRPIPISAIPDQIKQVIINLSLNAIEAMQPSGGMLSIVVDPKMAEDSVEIAFKDTGPGIPQAHLSRLFDPFFTTKEAGLGLGLAICDDIVRGHGGQILVESQSGVGATFVIQLPLLSEN